MNSKRNEALQKLGACLPLKRKAVGIRFLFTREEYEACPVPEARARMAYCVMVKVAGSGTCMKANLALSGCGGGTRALGLETASERCVSGCEALSFGLYQDLAVARQEVRSLTFCQHKAYGLLIQPVESYTDTDPHVVVLITDSFGAMRLIQSYTYKFGPQPNFKMTGNQAVCSECTAYPYESNAINISMFCSGTRYLAGWGSDEIGVGLPYGRFIETCDGLYQSANGVETDRRKAEIRQNLRQCGLPDPGLRDGDAYYMRLESAGSK